MEAIEEMRNVVGPGQVYRRKDVAQPDEVSYVVNRDGNARWFARWALIVQDRPEHIFEASWRQGGFASRDAAANSLVDRFEEPMRYLRLYKGDNGTQ